MVLQHMRTHLGAVVRPRHGAVLEVWPGLFHLVQQRVTPGGKLSVTQVPKVAEDGILRTMCDQAFGKKGREGSWLGRGRPHASGGFGRGVHPESSGRIRTGALDRREGQLCGLLV